MPAALLWSALALPLSFDGDAFREMVCCERERPVPMGGITTDSRRAGLDGLDGEVAALALPDLRVRAALVGLASSDSVSVGSLSLSTGAALERVERDVAGP